MTYKPVFARKTSPKARAASIRPPSQSRDPEAPPWEDIPAWDSRMKKDELLLVAKRRGIPLPDKILRKDLITLLEDDDSKRIPSSVEQALYLMNS